MSNEQQNNNKVTNDRFSTSSSLLVGLQNGDSRQWDRFVNLYKELVCHWCKSLVPNLSGLNREEIVQNIFVKIHGAIDTFDLNRENRKFRAWLRTITQTCIADFFREKYKIRKQRELLQEACEDGLLPSLEELQRVEKMDFQEDPNEKAILMRQVLKEIHDEYTEEQWEIFNLFINAEKTSREVAEIMNKNQDSVRKTKNRMLKRIRQLCIDYGFEEIFTLN